MTSRDTSSLSEYYRLPPVLPNAESYKHYLEAVCNNATVALFIMDDRQHCVFMNAAAERLTGYTLSEVQGRALHDVIHHTRPDGRPYPLCECPIDQAFPQNNQEQGEEVFVHKDGHFYSVAYTASPIREASGIVGTIIEVRDITQDKLDEIARREAAEALRQSEERFRQFSENVQDVFWITDLKTPRLLYVNSTYEEIWQRSAASLYETYNWLETIHPDDRDRVQAAISQALEEGYEIEYRIVRPDGTTRWIRDRGFILPEPNGDPYRMAGIAEDITERKQAELEREQLLARERHYINQLQGLTTAALAINSALSVEQVLQVITDQAAAIVGAHQSVTSLAINQNWGQAINAVYLSEKYAAWWDYQAPPDGSGIYACVCYLNRPMRLTQAELEAHPHWKGFGNAADNHPPLRGWLAAPLMGRDGKNIGLIQLSDKSEGEFTEADEAILVQLAQMASVAIENAKLYEAEQQARAIAEASREQAQAANRVKDEFLAVISHELRTPMNPILGWSRLLRSGKLDSAQISKALEVIDRNAQLQAQLIDDLLDISRILRGKLTLTIAPVHLSAVIAAALETVRLAAEAKSLSIHTQLSPTVGVVNGDAGRLQQVVWNLLSNAVKFTPPGGQVFVELEQNGNHVEIRVCDTGKGINPEFLPYVFEHFRQEDGATTRKFGGLGLGLSIVRQLVELHGGTVWADSLGEGQGATFTVQLPLSAPTAPCEDSPTMPCTPTQGALAGLRVLVVDDEPDSLELVAFVLEQAGAAVKTVASGRSAIALLLEFAPDILVSDIGMPEMDGYMLIQQIRQLAESQAIPAIALTAYAGELDQQRAMAAGFQRHMAKPVDPDLLIRAIHDLCRLRAAE